MATLILLRHGESVWNKQNLFTGWVDIPLSPKGIKQALAAGVKLAGEPIDVVFTSKLIRAQATMVLAMADHGSGRTPVIINDEARAQNHGKAKVIPVFESDALNERCYGALQGLNKEETAAKYGKEQVQIWRRSYKIAPPGGESLADASKRTLPYFDKEVISALKEGKNVLVVAHGNSIRSILMEIENISEDDIVHLEIPLGEPLKYAFENGKFRKW